jgi:hypothetical protein
MIRCTSPRTRGRRPSVPTLTARVLSRVPATALAWGLALGLGVGPVTGLASARAADDASWQLRQEDPVTGLRVWLRERAGQAPAFRATMPLQARLSAVAAVLLDHTRTQDWVFRARESVLLESDGPARGVTLVHTALPWPLADRESVVSWQMTQDPQTLVVTMAGHAVPHAQPTAPGRVRMPAFESRWQLTPLPGGWLDVRFEGHGDLGGNLARPLLRDFVGQAAWQAPWHTLQGLREIVQRPEFSQAVLPFIREPAP